MSAIRRIARTVFLLILAALAPASAANDERDRVSGQIVDGARLDRLQVAMAQGQLARHAPLQQKLDDFLYQLRPPAVWNAKHPAWAPARAALIELARADTSRSIKEYWKQMRSVSILELQGTFTPPEAEMLLAFVESPGGKAWSERRLADLRLKNGEVLFELEPESPAELKRHADEARKRYETLPAAEKKRVDEFVAGAKCPQQCARPPATVLESFLARQSTWLVDVFTLQFGSTDWRVVETWKTTLDTRLRASLPVDSKKQLLGALEMRGDATLAFRFHFYWKDRADGGSHTLEFSRGHPNYAEVLALAPGLAAGQSRLLYRDERGIIDDKP